ncbi:ABC-three component system middle component 2 [Ascidiimonas sp. W6]|uniref:ABC-three component system middle component 2 n=1 Tax=Ascidiimonas meishanensis TaxID=3128903 RepID=UPI0030EC8DE4
MNTLELRDTKLFNSPLEIGLRTLFVLNEVYPNTCDLQRLVYYDYLLVHSNDVDGGPKSIHPDVPHRSSEILVKRELLKKGLILMSSKELVKPIFNSNGIFYSATELTEPFLNYLQLEYANALRGVAKWLIETFAGYDDKRLENYIKNNLDVWGGEFSKESLLRGKI